MKKLSKEKTQEVTNFLSKCGLSSVMTAGEVAAAVDCLQVELGNDEFHRLRAKVLFNLQAMKEGTEFFHAQFFKGTEFKAYVVMVHEFIIHHPEYEFNETYTRTQRRSKIVLPPKKVVETAENE